MTIQLIDAARQVEQAQSVLSMWLEFTRDAEEANKVAAILTLLHGVPEVMDKADEEMAGLEFPQLKGLKS
ncbi:hypothetical protein [Tatumella sp. UBA2305]|uniref:hypothetical protein n=1 Tax=Tatumella sp. UBA2305 TaxID=1947647 RepID=UPI0025E1FAD7|nr:hypothetical protein [Tatumella sp. UBA2305]